MNEIDVVIGVVRHERSGDVLLLRKAQDYRETSDRYGENPWEMTGGKIAHEMDAEETEAAALRELKEETGLTGRVDRVGKPFDRDVDSMTVTFHPVLIRVDDRDVELSTEHDRFEWVDTETVDTYGTEHETTALAHVTAEDTR